MVDLKDWDLPIPNWIIFGWLGLLEAILFVGMAVFVITIFEGGGYIPTISISRNPVVLVALVAVLTVTFAAFKSDTNFVSVVRQNGR